MDLISTQKTHIMCELHFKIHSLQQNIHLFSFQKTKLRKRSNKKIVQQTGFRNISDQNFTPVEKSSNFYQPGLTD